MNQSPVGQLANEAGASEHPRQGLPRGWAAHAVWILLAILVCAPTIHWLWQRWTMSVWHNGHGIFIPFIVAYFIYVVLRSDQTVDADQSAWGFVFVIAGLGMIVLDSAIQTQLLSAFGMIVCLPGLSLLLLGRRRTQRLFFVWILAFFMLPIPAAFIERFLLLLRRISAAGAEPIISLFGVPVIREDTALLLPRGVLYVTDACSGFSALYAAVTLAVVLAFLSSSWQRRTVTLVAAFPIAIACNILRCALLALIVQHWGFSTLETVLHPASGVLTFIGATGLLLFLSDPGKRGRAA